jgi:TorA maturation chaperone TorD
MKEPDSQRFAEPSSKMTIYSLLAQAINYPGKDLVKSLTSGEFTSKLSEALQNIGINGSSDDLLTLERDYAKPGNNESVLLLELEKDYTWMCFASKPRQVYLFESVYREGKLLQESTFQIARLYYDAGLKLSEDFKLPPDHIAVEFEFMAYLCFNEVNGIKNADHKVESYAIELQKKVLEEHLQAFGLFLSEKLGQHAKTAFYRVVARIVKSVLS